MFRAATNFSLLAACLSLAQASVQANVRKRPPEKETGIPQYSRLLAAERQGRGPQERYEGLAAGIAALSIGLYGYYNDDRGTLVKFAYSSLQTAGVFMISDMLFRSEQPSLLLTTDGFIKRRGSIDYQQYQRAVVAINRRKKRADTLQLAYGSAILTGLYGFNGYREKSKAMQNILYFLGGNFLLIAGAGFYQLYDMDPSEQTPAPTLGRSQRQLTMQIALLPHPSITWRF